MEDKETIYDNELYPLMEQVMNICKTNDIPVFAVFQYANDGFCSSMKYGRDSHVLFKFFDAIAQSKEGDGINIDKFMFWIIKRAKKAGHSSIVLKQLDIPLSPSSQPSAVVR